MKKSGKKVSFIGAGNIAEALISGFISSGKVQARSIAAADIRKERLATLSRKYGIRVFPANAPAARFADILILAVKPAQMDEALASLAGVVTKKQLVISVAAGITTKHIERYLKGIPVIRVMPNTPALAGKGCTGVSRGSRATGSDERTALGLFSSVGIAAAFPERMLDAVTAVSGSGPAYVFYFTESLAAAARTLGFTEKDAARMAIQTVAGAAAMLESSGERPEELRRKVTLPGGTTEQAVRFFEKKHFKEIIRGAVESARRRAGELSR